MGILLALLATLAFAGTLRVDVLDVGQGDSILIRTPANKVVLIDAGEGDVDVPAILAREGIDHIDLVVATHPHADHIGGMDDVVRALPVKLYSDNGLAHTTQTYDVLMRDVEEKGIAYREAVAGQVYNLDDGAKIEVLHPGDVKMTNTRSDLNANSVVTRLTHQGHCFLFLGDAEEPTERALMTRGLGACDVLKVAHHGSNHSSTSGFLADVKPKIALVSVGRDNRYGHPGDETLERLQHAGATVYRTDLSGQITIRSSEKGLDVQVARPDGAVVAAQAAPEGAAAGDSTPAKNLAPASAAGTPPPACPFPASASSEVFHESGCGNAERISPSNLICYADREAAVAAGRRPGGCCKP
ncbi:MAG: ComEC/Rec2 family competence protein [Myxococcota bacterium]